MHILQNNIKDFSLILNKFFNVLWTMVFYLFSVSFSFVSLTFYQFFCSFLT